MSGHGLRLGVDLGGSKIAAAVLDADDQICARRRMDTPRDDYAATIAAIGELVGQLEQDMDETGLSVGVGTPGSVLPDTGLIHNANSQCLNGKPLGGDLEAALARPVRLANDADCLALSEAYDGAGAGCDSVFAIILGTGVGAGIVINGQLVSGRNGLAGEWGHIQLPWASAGEQRESPRCWCGLEGCLETWLSGPGMSADYVRRGGKKLSAQEVVAAAKAGERLAGATFKAWLTRVSRALGMVVNLLDPDIVVVGGGLSQIEWLYSEVPKIWTRHVFTDSLATRISPAVHGDASGVLGAARLWPLPDAP